MNKDEVTRRQFLSAGMVLSAAAVVPQLGGCANAAPAANTKTANADGPKGLAVAPVSQTDEPKLTMHAIDTFHGVTGAGLRIDLSILEGDRYRLIRSYETVAGGRTAQPLLNKDELKSGRYEILLHLDEYFSKLGAKLPTPPFLSKVPIRFTVSSTAERYHVPILFNPWSYSYYRGS